MPSTTQTTVQFENTQISSQKYWYEKVPYTFLEPTLTTGQTNVFNVNSVGTATQQPKIAILSDISVTQLANLNLQTQHSTTPYSNPTLGYPALNTSAAMSEDDRGVRSTKRLGLSFVNSTGASQTNTQCNYSVAVKNLTTADKILRGLSLTQQDQQYATKFNLRGEGKRPLPVSRVIQQYILGQILDEDTFIQVASSVTSSSQTLFNFSPNPDELLVLTDIAANAPVGNLCYLSVSRDSQKGYCQVLADNMVIDTPTRCWIPSAASEGIIITASANTASSNVPVRVSLLRIKLTPYIQVLFGLYTPSPSEGELYAFWEQVQAGVWS